MKTIDIYTDGACSGNPGVGGWSAILIYNGIEKEISGAEKDTTNNRMELTAIINGIKCLKETCNINLYSDSAYSLNAFINGWINDWINNNWKTSTKKPVKNIDLWKELIELSNIHNIRWIKVAGHQDNEYNNRCDKLAKDAIKKQL